MTEEEKKAAEAAEAAKQSKEGKPDVMTKDEVAKLLADQAAEFTAKMEAAVKEAASKEKEKLYDTIDKYKKDTEALTAKAKAEEDEKNRILKEEADKKKEELDAKERVKQLEVELEKTAKRFEEVMEIKDKQFTSELTKRDLAIIREKLIGEANGAIIPELVQGNTEEELRKSAESAKARFSEIVTAQKKQVEDELIRAGKIPGPDGKNKETKETHGDPTRVKSMKEIFGMPDDDFIKYKDEYLKSLSQTS